MSLASRATAPDAWHVAWAHLTAPLLNAPWSAWRTFWLEAICDDRFVVLYFLPLTLILLLAPPKHLRATIVATGLLFVAYAFGVLYAGLWLLTCHLLYRLGERHVQQCEKAGPRTAAVQAMVLIAGWYMITMSLRNLSLPANLNAWLWQHMPWLYPLGARGWPWEPFFSPLHDAPTVGGPFPLVRAVFNNVHNIGIAYLAVRMLHYFSELHRGTLPPSRRTLLNFLAYTCYGPTLMQGPLERFTRFHDELDSCHTRRGWHTVSPALGRVGLGVLKSLIATRYFQPLLREVYGIGRGGLFWHNPEQIQSFALLYLGVFFVIFTLYLEFTGYCDVAAGIARVLGYRQIENFRRPWLATSLRDFWRRWHISLSEMLRDYVYIPLGGGRRRATFNLCVTFFLCAIWHSLSPRVAVWGVVMGLLVAVNHAWSGAMKRLDAQPDSRLATVRRGWLRLQPLPRICAWLLTQHAFVFSLLIFFGGTGAIRVLREIARRVWQWVV